MRIICEEYHDFYDSVMSIDQDRELIYHRKIKEVEPKVDSFRNYPICPKGACMYNQTSFQVYSRLVGFCGKVFPVLQLATDKTKDQIFAHNIDDVNAFVKAHYKDEEYATFLASSKDSSNLWAKSQRYDKFAQYFEYAKKVEDNYGHVFQEFQAPIWVYDPNKQRNRLILNAPLKYLEFFKIMDAYTAYQELCMFYGGMAQPLKPIPEMSDEVKAEASGHGGKYSFRKPPSNS